MIKRISKKVERRERHTQTRPKARGVFNQPVEDEPVEEVAPDLGEKPRFGAPAKRGQGIIVRALQTHADGVSLLDETHPIYKYAKTKGAIRSLKGALAHMVWHSGTQAAKDAARREARAAGKGRKRAAKK